MAKTEKGTPNVEEPKKSQAQTEFEAAAQAAAGLGYENMREGRDTTIPFLQIVQDGSPQKKREHAKFIAGAETGDVFNSVTNKLYKMSGDNREPLVVVPVGFMPVWAEWKLRLKGGGFVKHHMTEAILGDTQKGGDRGTLDLLKSNLDHQIVTTAMHSVIVKDKDGNYPAVIAMTSTQLKKSRNWNSRQKSIKLPNGMLAPIFYKEYELTTVAEVHPGGTAYGWIITTKENNVEGFAEALDAYKRMQITPALPAPSQDDGVDDVPSEPNDLPKEKRPY